MLKTAAMPGKEVDEMKTALYLRKSRAEELGESTEDALRRHRETLEETARDMGLVICGVYEEVASGEDLYARPEMLRLLRDVREGRYEAVLCMDVDRLGRGSMSQQGVILEAFQHAGVKIITPQKTYDLDNEMDEDYTELQTFFARKELKLIKKRLRRGQERTAAEGGYLANAPFGYEKTRAGRLPTLRINEEEARFVRAAFDHCAAGESCPAIARFLNACGARPRRSAAFTRGSVLALLRNPVYTGAIVWNRRRYRRAKGGGRGCSKAENPRPLWLTAEGCHEAVVPPELFRRVQELLSSRARPAGSHTLRNPFAGLIRCANCGGLLQLRARSNAQGGYLVCERKGCCPSAGFRETVSALHQALLPILAQIPLQQAPVPESAESAALLRRAEKNLLQQEERLRELLETGVYSVAVYEERSRILNVRREKLAEETARLPQKAPADDVLQGKTAADAVAAASPAEENRIWRLLVAEILYRREPGKGLGHILLDVHLRFLPPKLAQEDGCRSLQLS